jgi:hypothetical protein
MHDWLVWRAGLVTLGVSLGACGTATGLVDPDEPGSCSTPASDAAVLELETCDGIGVPDHGVVHLQWHPIGMWWLPFTVSACGFEGKIVDLRKRLRRADGYILEFCWTRRSPTDVCPLDCAEEVCQFGCWGGGEPIPLGTELELSVAAVDSCGNEASDSATIVLECPSEEPLRSECVSSCEGRDI